MGLMITAFWIHFGTVTLLAVLAIQHRRRWMRTGWIVAITAALFSNTALYLQSGHLPFSGDFERLQALSFMILAIGVLREFLAGRELPVNWILPMINWLILVLAINDRMVVSEDFIIYHRIDVGMFFYLRKLAIALFIAATSEITIGYLAVKNEDYRQKWLSLIRNLILLGGGLFLSGEFAGSVWALLGWGDPWRWSRGFLLAGAMFLLSLTVLHLPIQYLKTPLRRYLLTVIPLVVIIFLYLF